MDGSLYVNDGKAAPLCGPMKSGSLQGYRAQAVFMQEKRRFFK